MQELLKNIFEHNGFRQSGQKESAFFYEKTEEGKREYFLVDFIAPPQLTDYLQTSNGEAVFNLFEEKKSQTLDIEKNTSLIICVKLGNIKNEVASIRNKILIIEEDDFWFKKYVILYTDDSIPTIEEHTDLNSFLSSQLLNAETFKQYKEDIYVNEAYFLIIQLFLKLPFLIVPLNESSDFRTIDNILAQTLSNAEYQFALKLRDIDDLNDAEYWTRLQNNVTVIDSEQLVTDFLNKFESNA